MVNMCFSVKEDLEEIQKIIWDNFPQYNITLEFGKDASIPDLKVKDFTVHIEAVEEIQLVKDVVTFVFKDGSSTSITEGLDTEDILDRYVQNHQSFKSKE